MKQIVILARDFPRPGGRMSLVREIIRIPNFKYAVLTRNKGKRPIVRVRCNTGSLIEYHLRSFTKLLNMNGRKIFFSTGLSSLGGLLYSKLSGSKIIYNVSGIRGRNVVERLPLDPRYQNDSSKFNIFKAVASSYSMFSDMICLNFSDLIVAPTETTKRAILARYPGLEDKIRVIFEGALPKKPKQFNIKDPIVFFKTDKELFVDIRDRIKEKYPEIPVINIIPNSQIELYKDDKMRNIKADLCDIFHNAKLVIGLPQTELHSTTILEAMNERSPIFLSDVGWIKEEFSEYPELLISRLNAEYIFDRIDNFLSDPRQVSKASRAAANKLSKKYVLEKSLKILQDIFNEI